MAEIFALQVHAGASHYEAMTNDVSAAREGVGWYIWLPDKGPEIAAWTPVKFANHVWTIGLSTPLFEILEATRAKNQEVFIIRTLIFVTILSLVLLIVTFLSKARRLQLEGETYETKIKLQALIEAIPDIIYFKDTKGRYLLVNKAFEKMFGMDRDDILGREDSELFPDELSQVHQRSDEQVIKEEKPYRAEQKYLNKKNEPLFFEVSKVPLFNQQNDLMGLVGISRDITERKQDQDALERKIVALTGALDDVESITFEDLFKMEEIQRLQDEFSQAMGVASIITQPDGTPITDASNFCRLCKEIIRKTEKGLNNCVKSDAAIGRYNPDGPTIQPCFSGGLWDAGAAISVGGKHVANWLIGQVRDETQSEEEMRLYAREIGADENAAIKAFHEVPSMSYAQFSRIARLLFTLANQLSTAAYHNIQQARFIVEREKKESALLESREKLARSKKMESLGLLAGGVAHDLNNILSGIVSYPELILLDMSEDDKFRKPIECIMEAGIRATAIVQDLLTVARGVAIAKEPVNLNNLIEEFLSSPEFKKIEQMNSYTTFSTSLDREMFNVMGSSVHLRKILMNLVANAAEAIVENGHITIATQKCYVDKPISRYHDVRYGDCALLTVVDNGPGISDVDLERIFEPFYTKKIMGRSGTGLGLAVVWSAVEDHNGYIDVKTGENGTAFNLFFPVTRSDEINESPHLNISRYQGNGETILVIDDIESQREISGEMLKRLGYRVQTVASGEEAVEYVKKHPVDLLLLDMIMDPGIDGYETYKKITEINPNQKAIIVSGFAETTEVKATQALGAGLYLKKPLTLEKLGVAVNECLVKVEN